ncbi:hypothetical protein OH77DRAFT_1411714 [Trametes cingulata]|nr:hypothetical protein OH77DRAFT_1411714 [Trametes cingulata]
MVVDQWAAAPPRAPSPLPVPAHNPPAPPAQQNAQTQNAQAQNAAGSSRVAAAGGDDPYDAHVAQVLEILPDVAPAHVYALVARHFPAYGAKVVEPVLHELFEDPNYPRAGAGGKRKRGKERAGEGERERAVRPRIDYGDKDRKFEGGELYYLLALERLATDFPSIPLPHIRATLHAHNSLYAPTFLALHAQRALDPPPYKPIARPRAQADRKGKGREERDEELEREVRWVQEWLDARRAEEVERAEREAREKEEKQEEGGIECGCCFSEYPFDKMVQCPDAHLFCVSCMLSYAETKLGAHDARLVCMDQSGCTLPFSDGEIRRFLSAPSPSSSLPSHASSGNGDAEGEGDADEGKKAHARAKLLELWERVKQRKEIEAAGLEGLEECPFCEYKVVIENDMERLFRCENEACGTVTCRQCKKPDHLPKSCQEVADDKKLDIRHAIEEAMTAALMRNCPKCQKAFIKEMGCNKMTCPNCGSLSCYVCRKLIAGYDHFGNPPPYTGKADPNKCPLWDTSVEGRHSDEVTAAAKRAIEEFKRAHPEIDEKDLAVDLPPPPPPPPAGPSRAAHLHGVPPPPIGVRAEAGLAEARAAMHPYRPRAQPAEDPLLAPAMQAGGHVQADPHARVNANPPAHAHAPVYNVEVHINHNQPPPAAAAPQQPLPQAAFFQLPPFVQPNVNLARGHNPYAAFVAAPAAPPVAQRRSKRVQGRRAN